MEQFGSIVHDLGVETELRFVVHPDFDNTISTMELLAGYAEIQGAEVVHNKIYAFPPSSSVALFTWKGCSVKLDGYFQSVIITQESLIMVNVCIHGCLEEMRITAESNKTKGPISLVVGPTDAGKTSFCRFLLNYAARLGRRPVYVDLDVGQTMVSIPGTICILPVDRQGDVIEGFKQQTLSVYPFGHKSPGQNMALYYLLIKKLGQMIKTRMKNASPNTQSSGVIIDTCGWTRGAGYSAITLAACSFEINNLFVIEEERLYQELRKDMPSSVKVVFVPKQHGVFERSKALRGKSREKRTWEYFYGIKGDLKPHEIRVNFSDVGVYSIKSDEHCEVDAETVSANNIQVVPERIDPNLKDCILGLSFADTADENLPFTNIIGFVSVIRVSMKDEVLYLLSPQPGPLPTKILLKGDMKLKNPHAY